MWNDAAVALPSSSSRLSSASRSHCPSASLQVPNLIFHIEEFERHLIRLSAGGAHAAGRAVLYVSGAR